MQWLCRDRCLFSVAIAINQLWDKPFVKPLLPIPTNIEWEFFSDNFHFVYIRDLLDFDMAHIITTELACLFLCGKEKLSITNIVVRVYDSCDIQHLAPSFFFMRYRSQKQSHNAKSKNYPQILSCLPATLQIYAFL